MKPISTKELELYPEKPQNAEGIHPMALSEHLNELRNRIIICSISLIIGITIGFLFSRQFIFTLTRIAPSDTLFFQIKPGEFFFTCFRAATFLGILLSSPIILWQLGTFILPGLTLKEKKIAIPILVGSSILFLTGSIFAYYFVVNSMLNFLFGFGKDVISTSISIENYISFVLLIMAICGFTFLLPIVILALSGVGIVNSSILINKWRYAIFLGVVLGAILTPTPDPFNMGIVSGILITLYFLSVLILRIINR
jgi:sec-independent protein translocase protein TatC